MGRMLSRAAVDGIMSTQTTPAVELARIFSTPHEAIQELEKGLGRSVTVREMMEIRIQDALCKAYEQGLENGMKYYERN